MQTKLVLDDWQEDILKWRGHCLLCTGRQVGKTTIFARKAAHRMIDSQGTHIIVASLTEDQAKLIILMVLDFLEREHKPIIKRGKWKPTQNRIMLKNGSQIIARPVGNTGDAIRGFTGDVLYIDEAAKMSQLIWDSAKPTLLTTAGEIWMSSTPFGKQGHFYESFTNKNNRFKVFHISSEEVIHNRPLSESWTEKQRTAGIKFLEDEKESMSELSYGQEYLGLFLDDLRRYFTDELIDKVCTLKRPQTIKQGAEYYIGADLARLGADATTFEILRKISNDKVIQVENIVKHKRLTTQTEDDLIQLAKTYKPVSIGIDAGSGTLGVSILDHLLLDDSTKRIIVPIDNKKRKKDRDGKQKGTYKKADLYDNLRSMMEKGVLHLLDDPEIRLALTCVQYEFEKDPKKMSVIKITGNDLHIVEGLTRAAIEAKEKSLNIWLRMLNL